MFLCAWLVLVCREKNVHPLRDFCRFFKKQSKVGRVLLGMLFIAMWIYASVKPGVEGNVEQGTGNRSGTNETLRSSSNTTRMLTAEDFERGFVMTRIGMGEEFDFSMPSNAVVCADWRVNESVKCKV